MKNQSCRKEISLEKKKGFLLFAIGVYTEWDKVTGLDRDWDGICIVFKGWANIHKWNHMEYMFPELWKEIRKALDRVGYRNVIDWSNAYACKGRILLLERVLKQIS